MAKIGLDYGHGNNTFPPSKGVYKGGIGYHEHDFNAKLGLKLKKLLIDAGHTIVEGQGAYKPEVSLNQRIRKYNNANVDLVFSIHANANADNKADGRCVFYWHTSKNGKRAADLIVEGIKNAGYSTHGNGLHASMRNSWTNLAICRDTNAPGILTENGFMSNDEPGINDDFELIFGSKQDEYTDDLALAHFNSLQKYFGGKTKDSIPKVVKEKVKEKETTKPKHKSKWIKVTGNWTGQTLKNGQYGEPVKQLQTMLKNKGYLKSSDVDDYFGDVTEKAVQKAQKDHKVTVDGLAGKNTYVKLNSTSSSKADLTVDGKWGGSTTKALQIALGTTVDGILSSQPRNSVTESLYGGITFGSKGSLVIEELQRIIGAVVDGKLGPGTIRSLQRYLGTTVDGVLSRPSMVVEEMQRRLNAGTF